MGVPVCGGFYAYCGRQLCLYCRGSRRPPLYRSSEYFYVDVRISFTRCGYILNSTVPPPNSTTGVQLADASDLKGVCARAVEDKSSDTSKRKAPPPDITTDVQLADASDLKVEFARTVKHISSGTSKRKAPPPDITISFTRCGYILNSTVPPPNSTTGVQLADASDLKGVCARAVEDKSSDTSKRKAPPPDITTDVQLPDASDLKVKFARTVKHKSSGTSKRKAPPPDITTDVQLPDASDLKVKFTRAVKLKSSGTSKRKAPPPDTTSVQLVHASVPEGVYARPVKDKSSDTIVGYKYEPRLIPPREKVHDGTTRKFNRLSLGEYRTPDEAKIVFQIARFYYDKDQDYVQLDDHGQFKFFIPPMNERERRLAGEEKRKWVTDKVKQVYADLGIQKRNFEQLSVGNGTGVRSSHDSDTGVLEVPSVSSAAALEVPSCLAPLPPCDVVDGFGPMIDELLCPDSTNFLPQQSSLNCEMRYLGFGQILGDSNSLQADGVIQGIQGSIDGHLSPGVDFQQGWDLVGGSGSNFFAEPSDPVLQQLVHCQKQQLVVKASQIVDLEHRLCESEIRLRESEIRNSGLQQEIERLTSQLSNGSLI